MILVRVYDKVNDRYYKSLIYGQIDMGYYEKDIVFNPHESCFVAVPHLFAPDEPLVEYISGEHGEWDYYAGAPLSELNKKLKEGGAEREITYFGGSKEVVSDFDFLLGLVKDGKVPIFETQIKVENIPEKDGDWTYINTQADADEFMKLFAGFHDSRIVKMNYGCEEYYDKYKKVLTVTFDNSGWFGVAELCFEGVTEFHIVPPYENSMNDIYDATLLVRNESIFWASEIEEIPEDEDIEEIDYDYDFIKSLSLKWRKVG